MEIADDMKPTPAMVEWAFAKVRRGTQYPVKPGDFEYWLGQYEKQPVKTHQHYRKHYTDDDEYMEKLETARERDRAAVRAMYEKWQGRKRKKPDTPVDNLPGPHVATREQKISRLIKLRGMTREQAERILEI